MNARRFEIENSPFIKEKESDKTRRIGIYLTLGALLVFLVTRLLYHLIIPENVKTTTELIPVVLILISGFSFLLIPSGLLYWLFPKIFTRTASSDVFENDDETNREIAKLERKKTKQRIILVFISIILLLTVLTLAAIISGEFGEK